MSEMTPEQFRAMKREKDRKRKDFKGNDKGGKESRRKERKSGSTSLARSNSGHFKGAIDVPVVRN